MGCGGRATRAKDADAKGAELEQLDAGASG